MAGGALVGREAATAVLRGAMDDAVAGRGRLALIVGEAGIGKTALAAQVAGFAAGCGMGVLWATCWDGDGAPPYWPWVQVLRGHAAGYGHRPGSVDQDAAWITLLTDPPPAVDSGGGPERFALFDGVASTLLAAARVRPLLVVVDDLQWADVPSLLLLNFLARQLVAAPLLVVGAYRDEEVRPDDPRWPLLAQARGCAEVVSLTGLSVADVARLMASVSGTRPAAELAADVVRRTGGNPFFVREVTQLLVSRGGLAGNEAAVGGIPEGVRQVVAQRLARLPQACVSILTVAAVAGQETGRDLLARATGSEVGRLTARLDEAVRAGVLAPPPGPAGPYRFAHDLFRETLHDALTPDALARLHLRVARALQEPRGDGSGVSAAALADHLLQAAVGLPGVGELPGQAVRYGLLAAREATARLAYEDAVGHVRRQLDGLGPAGRLGDADRLELLLCRAEALRCAGEAVAARDDYRQVLELARRLPAPAALGRAVLGVHALGVESGASRVACVDLLEEALDLLGDEDSAVKARVLAGLARELFLSGPDERTRAAWLSTAAVETARRVGDDGTLAVCLLASHDTSWLPGTAARRWAIAREMGTVARRAGDRAFEAEACLLRASAGLELGDPAGVVDLEEFVRLGTAVGQPRYTYLVLTRRVALATMAGRFAEAERLSTEAAVLAEAIGEPDAWNVHTRQLWQLRSAQGRRVEIEAGLLATTLPNLRFWYQALLGLVLLERGERAEGLRAIGPAVLARPEQIPYVLVVQWAELGEAAAAAGLSAAVQRYYDAMRPFAGTVAVTAAAVGFDGAVDHHLGLLAAASGWLDDAVRHLEAASIMHERLAAWPWLARTRCELAAVLATRGRPADRDRVSALLDDVRQAAADFGMPGLQRRAGEIRLAPPNVFRRDGDGWHIAHAGREIRLRDVKGLADLATLLFVPGRAVPAATLAAGGHAPADFDADPVLDRQAQRQYRARLAELDAAIAEAHDAAPTATLAGERAFLSRELSAAVGLGHRDRRLGDDRERARKAVAGRIRDAIRRIGAVHPALGAHLDEAISTGNHCAYRPAQPVRWQSSPAAARSNLASDP